MKSAWYPYPSTSQYQVQKQKVNDELTGRIAVSDDELAVAVGIRGSVPDDLVHETRNANGIVVGASSRHDQVREGDVALVISTVRLVASFPAGGEHDLESDTIRAVGVEISLVGQVMAIKSALWVFGVVQAIESKRTLGQGVLVGLAKRFPEGFLRVRLAWISGCVRSSVIRSRQHPEVSRESGDVVAIEKVVTWHVLALI